MFYNLFGRVTDKGKIERNTDRQTEKQTETERIYHIIKYPYLHKQRRRKKQQHQECLGTMFMFVLRVVT